MRVTVRVTVMVTVRVTMRVAMEVMVMVVVTLHVCVFGMAMKLDDGPRLCMLGKIFILVCGCFTS